MEAILKEIKVRVPFAFKRSDEDIAASAVARLAWNVTVPPNRISVKVSKGVITLTGEIDRHFQSEAAERELRQISGVAAVDNRITVRPQVDVSAVSASISEALDHSWLFDSRTVTVKADGGTVHLGRTVRTMQERHEAVGAGLGLPGHHGCCEQHQRRLSATFHARQRMPGGPHQGEETDHEPDIARARPSRERDGAR